MLKIKNNFILFIFVGIFIIIGLGLFNSIFFNQIDRSTFVLLVEGEGKKNDKVLSIDSKELLEVGDIIETIGNEAIAVIEWGDGSVTRLGGNSVVKIEELSVSSDISKINISFNLEKGKTWSNVISFLGNESYFKETFSVNDTDTTASVRGTIFDLDLDNNYINVVDHKLELSDATGKNIIINKFNPLSLLTFDFIKYEDFIKNVRDNTWNQLNKTFDNDLFLSLKTEISKKLPVLKYIDLANLSLDEKNELYNKLITEYQSLNFVKSDDTELFDLKLSLKKQLISLADKENKSILIENTLYDFKDSIINKNKEALDNVIIILNENKDLLDNIDVSNYLNDLEITEDLNNILKNELELFKKVFKDTNKFKEVLENDINGKLDNIGSNIKEAGNGLNNVKDILDKGLEDELNKTLGKFIN